MDTILTIKDLRKSIKDYDDNDQVVLELNDKNGDVIDLSDFYIDEIEGLTLTTGETVREIRFCQIPYKA